MLAKVCSGYKCYGLLARDGLPHGGMTAGRPQNEGKSLAIFKALNLDHNTYCPPVQK